MLTVQLHTYAGESCALPALLGWELEYTGGVPCDGMSVTCPYDGGMAAVLPKATRFTALWDGDVVLRGVVDAYEVSMSQGGLLVTVEGRGMAALLLDNESEALAYGRATLPEILKNHVSPYGLAYEIRQWPVGDGYTVASGSSQWKALQVFTRRYGGFDPYFTKEGKLVVGPLWGTGKLLQIDDSTPLLSLTKREDRYGVISEVLIQDKSQGVSQSVVNRAFAAAGGQRRHVLYMPKSTPDSRRYTGEYQIAESALEQLEIQAELPWAFAAVPGDRVSLQLSRLGLSAVYEVVEARSCMDSGGERTELTLSVR